MKNYIGIDLGTTNSAICSFDGEDLRLWKSPEQNDVTPSVILIDRRGNKYVGKRAYDSAPHNPDNAAMLFKRLMGTTTSITLPAVNKKLSPEDCSAEILKVLYGYLPEEVRNDDETGTVITVPAAFNQMQKDATHGAAEIAGIGKVALMQEPVAAVMSVMRIRKTDGTFLIYDLGGGTLDIAIAQSVTGRVTLLAHGGIAMCGGRDFDRLLVDIVIKPWLLTHFNLPEDFISQNQFKTLARLAAWSAERAKIDLSAKGETIISLTEVEAKVKDLSGAEIYLEIPLKRAALNELIQHEINESIEAARETLAKAGLTPHDLERIVFVGGPTQYKPLRDKVSFELGIPSNTDVNPMTAVAEGAALFAESIDWESKSRSRKSARGTISTGGKLNIGFHYVSRTPDAKGKIALKIAGPVLPGAEFQIDSLDTGWSSGRIGLKDGASVDVNLSKSGENTFKIFVFDATGGPMPLEENKIIITRTAATVDAIPASYSIGIEVLDRLGGRSILEYIIRAGDSLPKKGKKVFKAGESLKTGGTSSINFKIWEGEIEDPVTDNRFIGTLKITGSDFEDGVISAGDDLICEYEVRDSGNITCEVSVPSIGANFQSGRNFYSRMEGGIDYASDAKRILKEGELALRRVQMVSTRVSNPKLDQAAEKLSAACSLSPSESDPETCKKAMDKIFESKKLLARVRKEHLKEIRQIDLDRVADFFDTQLRKLAKANEAISFDNLARTAQRDIDRDDPGFENHLEELKGKNFLVLWRQDWFVVDRYKEMAKEPHFFPNKVQYKQLISSGQEALRADDIDRLRGVVYELMNIRIGSASEGEIFVPANIIRG